jgi:uncharacterized protein
VSLFGKDTAFFTLLEGQAQAACEAAEAFYSLGTDFTSAEAVVERIERIEHEADQLTHQLLNKVDSTFVTPFDKEDMHALASILDDVTDAIEGAAFRIVLYRIAEPHPDLEPALKVLVRATEAVHQAVSKLKDLRQRQALQNNLITVHDLEHEADAIFRHAVGGLFSAENPDPLYVMKWKEMFDRIEQAVNACENVADVMESVVIKYA